MLCLTSSVARSRRLFLPGVSQHVIQRGNNRCDIFRSPVDYEVFLDLLRDALTKHPLELHAYVLMTNHVHFMVTPDSARALPRVMQSLGCRYVRYFNDRYGRTGTLWEGRFRSFLISGDAYLLMCSRYIELNPVRAGMVTHPAEWPWSGYRTRAEGWPSALLQPDPGYLGLGTSPIQRQNRYCAWVASDIASQELQQLRRLVHFGGVFGNELQLTAIK